VLAPGSEVTRFDVEVFEAFTLPTLNGKPIDLRPDTTLQRPYLNRKFGDDTISVTVGRFGGC